MDLLQNFGGLAATGSLIALVVAGWKNIKQTFNYLSSFLVVRINFDRRMHDAFYAHIMKHFKRVRLGDISILTRRYEIDKRGTLTVPFKVRIKASIYYRGLTFFLYGFSDSTPMLVTIRGFFDVERETGLALKAFDEISNAEQKQSRFLVSDLIGSEKTFSYQDDNDGRRNKTTRIDEVQPSLSESGTFDLALENSYLYDRSEYIKEKGESNSLASLYYPSYVEEALSHIKMWYKSGDWYRDRLIPWRRGLLLYGAGGTGKSTLAKYIAQDLGIPIYRFILSTLSNREFIQYWDSMQTPCVALFDDFDTVFEGRTPMTEHKSLTFDTILGQVSGISTVQGVLLVITTNHIEKIDPALGVASGLEGSISTRPGRIDQVLELKAMEEHERWKLAERILQDWPEKIQGAVEKGEGMVPTQFTEHCVQIALTSGIDLSKIANKAKT